MHDQDAGQHIILVGAGLAGSLLAISLARRGYTVDVYERRPDMRLEAISAGRSINLALSARGIHALMEVGLYDEIARILLPMRGRMIHQTDGTTVFSQYGKDDTEVINSVSRAALNMRLMDLAERQDGVRIHFRRRCTGIDIASGTIRLRDDVTGGEHTASADTVIGTDGSASAIRTDMLRAGVFDFSESRLAHGYKELTIPAGDDGGFRLAPDALHIWPRRSFMMIALPNLDGTFTGTLFLQHDGATSFSSLPAPANVQAFFAREFPDLVPHMPDLVQTYFSHPVGSLGTIMIRPWHIGGRVALLGDAAHAIVPFFGQGMNCAFEDCSVLARCIDEHAPAWDLVYREYEHQRKVNADAIAELALENFIEMRDSVADPHFLLTKALGLELEKQFPDRFIPKYSMVSFHRIPYSVALERGRVQDSILTALSTGIDSLDHVDWARAAALVLAQVPPLDRP